MTAKDLVNKEETFKSMHVSRKINTIRPIPDLSEYNINHFCIIQQNVSMGQNFHPIHHSGGDNTVNNRSVYQASHKCSSVLLGCAWEHLRVSTVSFLLACTLHTCSSFSLINTDAGTPHSRYCQIVLPSFGNSSLAIQSFMSLNIISSVVLHLVFKSVVNTCSLCSG